ncbi:MAG: SRPBCC family protein [Ginsengibacter sp.]
MRRLSGFLIFLIFVFVVIAIISLLIPSKVTVARSVEINATPEEVSKQIADFELWKNWYPAFKDENITVIKNVPDSSSVTLKDKGGKDIILTRVETNADVITVDVHSSSSTKVNYRFVLTPKMNNQTQLTWDVNTDMGWYPWKKIQGILLDKFSGNQYEAALGNLKKAVEN